MLLETIQLIKGDDILKDKTMSFKNGDWVNLVRDDGIIFDTFQYDSDWCGKNGFSLEIWEPMAKDYIWDKHYGLCVVVSNNKENGILAKQLFFNKNTFTTPIRDIEPFVNELPSWI